MMIENMVPKIINIFFKMMLWILAFFVFLNAACFLYNFPKLTALSKMVQTSISKHGYMPYEDYQSIQTYIDRITYQAKSVDGPLNINKVITNLNIVVYDTERKGFPSGNIHEYRNENTLDDYYIDWENNEEKKSHKKQQGSILFAGIYCDYLILHPLNGWMLFDMVADSRNTQDITVDTIQSTVAGNPYDPVTVPSDLVYGDNARSRTFGYTTINTLDIMNQNDSSGAVSSLFVSPVITTEYYPDLPDNSGSGF